MIVTKTFNTIPGYFVIGWPPLYGATILSVDRIGLGQDQTSGAPVNTEFKHSIAFIYFNPNLPFNPGEKVQVIYEE